jgi:L-fucose mutarotase
MLAVSRNSLLSLARPAARAARAPRLAAVAAAANVRAAPRRTTTSLYGVPPVLDCDVLRTLAAMGHGDELVLADRNFPAEAMGKLVMRAPGVATPEMLRAVLQLLPLDTFEGPSVSFMQPQGGERLEVIAQMEGEVERAVLRRRVHFGGRGVAPKSFDAAAAAKPLVQSLGRHEFYERARKAFAVVATGDARFYGNVIVRKGVIGVLRPAAPASPASPASA